MQRTDRSLQQKKKFPPPCVLCSLFVLCPTFWLVGGFFFFFDWINKLRRAGLNYWFESNRNEIETRLLAQMLLSSNLLWKNNFETLISRSGFRVCFFVVQFFLFISGNNFMQTAAINKVTSEAWNFKTRRGYFYWILFLFFSFMMKTESKNYVVIFYYSCFIKIFLFISKKIIIKVTEYIMIKNSTCIVKFFIYLNNIIS